MELCRVKGTLVPAYSDTGFCSASLRILEKIDKTGKAIGESFVALDRIGADTGQIVLIETAMEATLGYGKRCAADAAIIAIVDSF